MNLSKVTTKKLMRELRRRSSAIMLVLVPSDVESKPVMLADGPLEMVNCMHTALTKHIYECNKPSALTRGEVN